MIEERPLLRAEPQIPCAAALNAQSFSDMSRNVAAAHAGCNGADFIRVRAMRCIPPKAQSGNHIEQQYLAWFAGAYDELGRIDPGHRIPRHQRLTVDFH